MLKSLMHQQVTTLLEREDIIFPPSVQNALTLRKLLIDPDSDNNTIANCIRKDPIVSLAVLKLANSPMYARETKDVKDALAFLGYSALNFLIFGILQRQLVNLVPPKGRDLIRQLWQYSLNLASTTYAVARTEAGVQIADESILLALVLHLDLMFVIYAVSLTDVDLEDVEYSIFVRRLSHQHRKKLLSLYGVDDETYNGLSMSYWSYPTAYLPAPISAIEALVVGINSTDIPFDIRLLVPAATYVNTLTQTQLEYKFSVAQSLNFQ